MEYTPEERRPHRVHASVSERIKKALSEEAYARSRPGKPVHESDIIYELIIRHYGADKPKPQKPKEQISVEEIGSPQSQPRASDKSRK